MPPFEEYIGEIADLWASHRLTNMGEKHKELEKKLKQRLGASNLALFVNGHNALECVLEAMGLRGKVITTPFTFASTTHAIIRKGLTPVFADIRLDDYTIDPYSIEGLIDSETAAIMPVHVYGHLCDIDAIQSIAEEYGLAVIYDAAHAFGVERFNHATNAWVNSACFGDAAMFSFHATKVFHTIEGGAICFSECSLGEKLNQWKNFGIAGPESVKYIGGNAKMNEFCAAMGLCNLRHFDNEVQGRRVLAERYWNHLENVPGVQIHRVGGDVRHNYAYMPVLINEDIFGTTRDAVFDALASEDIGARKYFYPLTSDYDCYAGRFNSDETPNAQYVAERIMTLPLYSGLAMEDVDRICSIVKGCAR